tara:strand:+ start:344 stop:694 length:351 start_codon:yes stop_codon:yes gene_type:complete
MAKKQLNYKDLTAKELENLKDIYIDLKVKSMTNNDLKDFATENISLQIKSTIGNDEELEAWKEMEEFFKEELENIVKDIKIKMEEKSGNNTITNMKEIKLQSTEIDESKKLDMWED